MLLLYTPRESLDYQAANAQMPVLGQEKIMMPFPDSPYIYDMGVQCKKVETGLKFSTKFHAFLSGLAPVPDSDI